MTASLYWLPENEGLPLSSNTPSHDIEILTRAFGALPCILGPESILILEGIRAAEPSAEIWEELLNALGKNNMIRVWARH